MGEKYDVVVAYDYKPCQDHCPEVDYTCGRCLGYPEYIMGPLFPDLVKMKGPKNYNLLSRVAQKFSSGQEQGNVAGEDFCVELLGASGISNHYLGYEDALALQTIWPKVDEGAFSGKAPIFLRSISLHEDGKLVLAPRLLPEGVEWFPFVFPVGPSSPALIFI